MKERLPLRALNEQSGILGLGMWDLCAVGYIFIATHAYLEQFGLGLLAFLVAAVGFVALSMVRSNYRTKIIRDTAKYILGEKVIYDPATRKN